MDLLAKRLLLAKSLSGIKTQLKMSTYDAGREAQILQKLKQKSVDEEINAGLTAIYQSLFTQSRCLQRSSESNSAATEPVPLYFPQVLIIGLGLIGGALARQIKRCLPETQVLGSDQADILQSALAQGIIDTPVCDPLLVLPQISLVILAAPPDENVRLLQNLSSHLQSGQLIIDVTSCKTSICREAAKLDLGGADFIGGHPFMGSEKSGLASSTQVTMEGRTFCLTPVAKSSEISLKRLVRWLAQLNVNTAIMSADQHDFLAAHTSHLVQLLSVALGSEMSAQLSASQLRQVPALAGPGLLQLLRLMSSPGRLWQEIITANRIKVLPVLTACIKRLQILHTAIEQGQAEIIEQTFEQAAQLPALQTQP